MNPTLRIDIDIRDVPYAPGVEAAADASRIPPEAFLLGGAGEYELLFAVPEKKTADFEAVLRNLPVTRVGATAMDAASPGVFLRSEKGRVRMETSPPCPRETESRSGYLEAVLRMAGELSCGRVRS